MSWDVLYFAFSIDGEGPSLTSGNFAKLPGDGLKNANGFTGLHQFIRKAGDRVTSIIGW